MDYVRLGSAGLKVSRICLGMMSYGSRAERAWHLDETEAEPIVKAAVEGRLPRGFGLKRLVNLPMAWPDQWRTLGLQKPALA